MTTLRADRSPSPTRAHGDRRNAFAGPRPPVQEMRTSQAHRYFWVVTEVNRQFWRLPLSTASALGQVRFAGRTIVCAVMTDHRSDEDRCRPVSPPARGPGAGCTGARSPRQDSAREGVSMVTADAVAPGLATSLGPGRHLGQPHAQAGRAVLGYVQDGHGDRW